jgi:hypothetical protein
VTLQVDGTFTFVPATTTWTSATFTYHASDGISSSAETRATFFLTTGHIYLPLIHR